MKKTVVALFKTYGEAERALTEALDAGFDRNAVSIMATPNPSYESEPAPESNRANAAAGAAVGGIAGAALGLTALAIPGVGPLVAAGPIAAALGATGAAAGAGGLSGLLIGLGITDDEAKSYASGVYDGGAIVAVHTDDAHVSEAERVLARFNPAKVNTAVGAAVPEQMRHVPPQTGGAGEEGDPLAIDPAANEPHKTEAGPAQFAPENPHYASSFDEFAGVFRRRHSEFLGSRGEDYDVYREAYDFGYRAAGEREYVRKSWANAEPDVRRDWEKNKSDWDAVCSAIQQGWEAARGAG
jgi:hypothetical protein